MTSSPGPTPSMRSARWSAAVPLESAAADGTPRASANSSSNAPMWGPTGAIQPESNASSNSSRSSSPASGGDKKSRGIDERYQLSRRPMIIDAARRPRPVPVAFDRMSVLVTGGAGFIGANLCRRLVASSERVVAIDDLSTGSKENLEGLEVALVESSILDRDALDQAMAGVSAVVHLAARPSVPRSLVEPLASHHTRTRPARSKCSKRRAVPRIPS